MRKAVIAALLLLVVIAVARSGNTNHPRPAPASSPSTSVGSTGPATVVGTEYERDSDNPTTGTHYADCRAGGGEYRVVVSAATEYRLRDGAPCPAGPHLPTARQEDPGLYDVLTAPLPFHGGDANGPCGEWEAADQADADSMRAGYARCMSGHGGGR
jgi:hypothetical protein